MSARVAIAEDIEFDPEYRRQRELARFLLGCAINTMRGSRPAWSPTRSLTEVADVLQKLAITNGLVWFDEWHHAPRCPSNNWSGQHLPEAPCNCGAQRHRIR